MSSYVNFHGKEISNKEKGLQNIGKKFNTVYKRLKLKLNVKKSKVMDSEKEKCNVIKFGNLYI